MTEFHKGINLLDKYYQLLLENLSNLILKIHTLSTCVLYFHIFVV